MSTKPEELFMQRMLKTISEYEVACCRDPRTGPRYVHRSCEDALAQLDDLEQRANIVASLGAWVQSDIAEARKEVTHERADESNGQALDADDAGA